MLISRKPYCNWCKHRCSSAYGPSDYRLYICGVKELADKYPERCRDGMFMVTEKMRCPDKTFFDPTYTKEQQKINNHHK